MINGSKETCSTIHIAPNTGAFKDKTECFKLKI